MERVVRAGERRAYASAVAGLWERLGTALARLERLAESGPERLAVDGRDELPALQYALHAGAELAVGIEAPPGAESVHAELVAALTHARDATAEVVAGLDEADDAAVERLLPEWRGALFRVRLARMRALERFPLELGAAAAPAARTRREPEARGFSLAVVVATVLLVAGGLLFTAGAVLAAWPLWAAGLTLFAGGFVLFRP